MLLHHSVIYLFARGVPGIIGFAMIVIYTRLLSPEAYGQYALVVSGAILVNAILYQWLSASLLRFLPQYQNNQSDFLATILSGFIFVSLLVGIAGLLFILVWSNPRGTGLIYMGILLVWVQAWFAINLELVRSHLEPSRYGFISFFKAATALGLGVVLISWGFAAYGALAGLIIGFFISGLWASWGEWKSLWRWRPDRAIVKRLLSYGLPLTASFALAAVISTTDRIMLGGLIDESATGLYAAGQELAHQTVGVLMTMVNLAAYPLIVRTLEQVGPEAARAQLQKNAILLLGTGLPIAVGFILLAPGIASVVLGREFQTAGILLMPWVAVATLLSGVRAYYLDLAFYLGKRTDIQMLVMVAAALLNVVLNFLFIPIFGLLGAAYASVAAHGFAVLLSAILGRRAFRLPALHGDIAKVLLSAIVMVVVLLYAPSGEGVISLAAQVAVGAVMYLSCVFVFDVGLSRKIVARVIAHRANFSKGSSVR